MKRTINGTRFDTQTADHIYSCRSVLPPGDYHHWRETLCVDAKDRWFVACWEGGPLTRFARPATAEAQQIGRSGCGIRPLSTWQARVYLEQRCRWAESNDTTDYDAAAALAVWFGIEAY